MARAGPRRRFGRLSLRPAAVVFALCGNADRVRAVVVGRLVDELDAVGKQKLKGRRFILRERVLYGAVVVSVVGHPARFADGPVGEVLE